MPSTRVKKRSELWERLRAVRTFAQLTQLQLGVEMKVSRAAITLWESRDQRIRTHPSAEQMMGVARVCRVPATWLVDEANDAQTLEDFMVDHRRAHAAAPAAAHNAAAVRQSSHFWQAVQHSAISEREEMSKCFDVTVNAGDVWVQAAFFKGARAAAFLSEPAAGWDESVALAVGKLLLLEKAHGKPLTQLLLVHTRTGQIGNFGNDLERITGIKTKGFNDIGKAAKYLMEV